MPKKKKRLFSSAGDHVIFEEKDSCTASAPQKRLVITSEEEMQTVLKEVHDNSGHQGIKRTMAKIAKDYYWLTITNDVKEWVG